MDDVVLAMRLNVELCEATEPVEQLDYRHVAQRFKQAIVAPRRLQLSMASTVVPCVVVTFQFISCMPFF